MSTYLVCLHLLCLSVGGASALSIYTILFLKLYSYKDVNLWCRELSSIKVKKLSRSLSCESQTPAHVRTSVLSVAVKSEKQLQNLF